MKKFFIELPHTSLIPHPQHKVIELKNEDKTIRFVRGKNNVILEDKKLTVCFSNMEKPLKVLGKKGHLKPGLKPSELVQTFGLELKEKVSAPPPPLKPKVSAKKKLAYQPPKNINIPLFRQVDDCILSLQRIISRLPEKQQEVKTLQMAIWTLKKIKFSSYQPSSLTEPKSLLASRQAKAMFQETVRFGHGLKRR